MRVSDFVFVREGIGLFCKEEETYGDAICTDCQSRLQPSGEHFAYDEDHDCAIAYFYNRFMQDVIQEFKFHECAELAEPIGRLLYEYVKQGGFSHITHIQPIPMHPRAERRRGYNQSVLMAHELAKHTGWQVADLLEKTKATQEQNKLNRIQREHNLADAFTCRPTHATERMHVLLLDDFVTTGNTMRQATRALAGTPFASVTALALTAPRRYR